MKIIKLRDEIRRLNKIIYDKIYLPSDNAISAKLKGIEETDNAYDGIFKLVDKLLKGTLSATERVKLVTLIIERQQIKEEFKWYQKKKV